MSYSQEFPVADEVYGPVQDQLVLGLPPLLVGMLLLLLIAAGVAGWFLGQRRKTSGASDGAAIWKAIDDAIRAAMTAHSDGLRDKATALSRTIDTRLGKTLALAGGLKGLSALKNALKDPEPPAPTPAPAPGPAKPPAPDGAAPAKDKPATEPNPSSVVIERASQVVIHNPPATPPPAPPAGPTPPPKPPTEAERRDAIRKAVSDLNDWWRLKEARIAEIEAAHRELSAKT